MSAAPGPDITAPNTRQSVESGKKHEDAVQIERVLSPDESTEKTDHMNYDRVDGELAKYANAARVDISEAEDKRLKRMIDKRVLIVMVVTYFIQALDKVSGGLYVY